MRGRLVAACVLALVGADAARAAAPPGAPTIGAARDADHRTHPGSEREWWRLRAMAARDYGSVSLELVREHGGAVLDFTFHTRDGTGLVYAHEFLDAVRAGPRSLDATGSRASLHVRRRARRTVADVAVGGVRCRLTLTAIRGGPAARRFDLGPHWAADPAYRRLRRDLSWSMPVARARTAARFVRDGRLLAAPRRWLGSYEHGWGDLDLGDAEWQHWDEYVVQRPRATWVLFGLNRTETNTGPGARDAMWLGVLARVTPSGMTACRPQIRRPRWHYPFDAMVWPLEVRARCGRLRAVFRDVGALGVDHLNHFTAGGLARVDGRGRGWAWHAGH
jgi:hypothetical protein